MSIKNNSRRLLFLILIYSFLIHHTPAGCIIQVMLSPNLVVFLGLGTTYALLFHLWSGRNLQHLLLFWLVSMLGFGLGYLGASLMPVRLFTVGGIPVIEASMGALVLLLFARRF